MGERSRIDRLWQEIETLNIAEFLSLRRRMNLFVKRDLISLPHELVLKVVSYLKAKDLLHLASVNKVYSSALLSSNTAWKHVFINESCRFISKPLLDYKLLLAERMNIKRNWEAGVYTTKTFEGHTDVVYCMQYNDNTLITGSRDNSCKIWDCFDGLCKKTLVGHTGSVLCLQHEKGLLITGSSDASIIIWEYYTGNILGVLNGHTQSVLNLQFDLKLDVLVTCSKDKTVKVWRVSSKFLQFTIDGHDAPVNAVQFANNMIVSGSGDKNIKVWSLRDGSLIRSLEGHTRGIACLQFDGKVVASGSSDKTIRVWNVYTGSTIMVLRGHNDLVRTISFDDDKIVSGSYDRTIRIWCKKTGKLIQIFENIHADQIFKVYCSARRLISASRDQTVKLLDFSTSHQYSQYFD